MFFFGKEQKSEENALFGFFDNLGCLVHNAKNGLKYFVKYSIVFAFQASPKAITYNSLLIISCSLILSVLKALLRIKYWNWSSKSGLKIYKPWLTGCDSHFQNPVVFNILKEPLQVQKQTIHQQKALNLSYLEPEGKGHGIIMGAWQWLAVKTLFLPNAHQCFLWRAGVAPSWYCHALVLLATNSWDQELSADVSFVSVLAMVLSEY